MTHDTSYESDVDPTPTACDECETIHPRESLAPVDGGLVCPQCRHERIGN